MQCPTDTTQEYPANPVSAISELNAKCQNVLGRLGSLEVRMATRQSEISAAQALRYRVFFDEMGAVGNLATTRSRRDEDRIDSVCDHLVVVDTADRERIVGTYRLLTHDRAQSVGGFYSDGEFELSALVSRHSDKQFLELGRSCVLRQYRTKRTIELLWQGIWAYCNRHSIDVMAGCASFPGTVPAQHAEALSFLAHFHRADEIWNVRALPTLYNSMDLMPAEAIDLKAAIAATPTLIKGYLRIGAKVGDGCVVDRGFNTTDILMVLPRTSISQRYVDYYRSDATRFAA